MTPKRKICKSTIQLYSCSPLLHLIFTVKGLIVILEGVISLTIGLGLFSGRTEGLFGLLGGRFGRGFGLLGEVEARGFGG